METQELSQLEEGEQALDVSPNNILQVTQEARLRILLSKVAVDKDMLVLLKDMSGQALGQLRITSGDENAEGDRAIALEIAKVTATSRNNPFINHELLPSERVIPSVSGPLVEGLELSEDNLSTEMGSPDLVELMEYDE